MSDPYTPRVHAETATCELRKAWEAVRDWWGLISRDPGLLAEIEQVSQELDRRLLSERFESKFMPEPMSGCWLWLAATYPGGHGSFSMRLPGAPRNKNSMEPAHRVSWCLYRGPIPDGLWVLHKCDNKVCVNPDHLYLGTVLQNARDWRNSPRWKPSYTKLAEPQVRDIYRDPRPVRVIAEQYGITHSVVSGIKRGEVWSHLRLSEGAA